MRKLLKSKTSCPFNLSIYLYFSSKGEEKEKGSIIIVMEERSMRQHNTKSA